MRILDVLEQENHDLIELFDKTLKDSCQNLLKNLLKVIIELKNQKEVNLIKNAEGVFCTLKRGTKILSKTCMSKSFLFKNSETQFNLIRSNLAHFL